MKMNAHRNSSSKAGDQSSAELIVALEVIDTAIHLYHGAWLIAGLLEAHDEVSTEALTLRTILSEAGDRMDDARTSIMAVMEGAAS
jgi:hypothetical protein